MTDSAKVPLHSKNNSLLQRSKRVFLDTIRGFMEDDCYAQASALTFFSLLSIVPFVAVLFGIAKGFGFEQALESEILEQFAEQPEVAHKLIQFAYSWLQSVKGGLIAGVGTFLLFWTVVGLLNNIEAALNLIWKTKISRSYTRKVSDYLAFLIIAPLILIATSSINVFLTTRITETAQNNLFVDVISPLLLFVLKLFPYFLSWMLFTFIYLFMPNTKVYFRSAIVAGVIGGTAFQVWQWIYIKFQIGAASYGAIYGSFAALPFFLIWLQISWLILLTGAEIAVQLENDLYTPDRLQEPLSNKAAAMLITYRCIEAFVKGERPKTDRTLAQELGMSLNHIHNLVEALQSAGILSEVSLTDKTNGYQPARTVASITMKDVADAIERNNQIDASALNTKELENIKGYLKDVEEVMAQPEYNQVLYPVKNEAKIS
jgi:membrane protein